MQDECFYYRLWIFNKPNILTKQKKLYTIYIKCWGYFYRHYYLNIFGWMCLQDRTLICLISSRLQMFFKTGFRKNFAIFTGKHICWSLLFKLLSLKLQWNSPSRLFSDNFLKLVKSTYNWKHLRRLLLSINLENIVSVLFL